MRLSSPAFSLELFHSILQHYLFFELAVLPAASAAQEVHRKLMTDERPAEGSWSWGIPRPPPLKREGMKEIFKANAGEGITENDQAPTFSFNTEHDSSNDHKFSSSECIHVDDKVMEI